jgi:hypothetical protein
MQRTVYLCCLSVAAFSLVAGFTPNTFALTGCKSATGINTDEYSLEDTIYGMECQTTPCANPGKCTYTLPGGGILGGGGGGIGTFKNCGPLTLCVLKGEDPPLSNPLWDEYSEGFQGLGANLISGRCPPPGSGGGYMLTCPAANR